MWSVSVTEGRLAARRIRREAYEADCGNDTDEQAFFMSESSVYMAWRAEKWELKASSLLILAICRFSCSFHLHLIAQSLRENLPVSGAANDPRALRHGGLIILVS